MLLTHYDNCANRKMQALAKSDAEQAASIRRGGNVATRVRAALAAQGGDSLTISKDEGTDYADLLAYMSFVDDVRREVSSRAIVATLI